MHGDAAGCVFAADGLGYGNAACGSGGRVGGYGADVLAGTERELHSVELGGDCGGGIYGLADYSGVGGDGGSLDGAAVSVEPG